MNGQTMLAVLAMDATRNPVLAETLKAIVPKSKDFELFWLDTGDGEPRYSFPIYNPAPIHGLKQKSGEWLFYLTTERDGQIWACCSEPIPTDKSNDIEFVSCAIGNARKQMQGCRE